MLDKEVRVWVLLRLHFGMSPGQEWRKITNLPKKFDHFSYFFKRKRDDKTWRKKEGNGCYYQPQDVVQIRCTVCSLQGLFHVYLEENIVKSKPAFCNFYWYADKLSSHSLYEWIFRWIIAQKSSFSSTIFGAGNAFKNENYTYCLEIDMKNQSKALVYVRFWSYFAG